MDKNKPDQANKAAEHSRILRAGENCWRIDQAEKAAFLIDGQAYFAAFREAVKRARKSVLIAGWDIDSRVALLRDDPQDGYPVTLGDFLNAAAKQQGLRIYVLLWDFAMLLGLEREWFPIYKLDWKTHHRVHLQMDDQHPVGASHHQKIVVVDDAVAFVGGLDLTKSRWDTPEHLQGDGRRQSPDGVRYRPHHDVQMLVAGKPAESLSDLFRRRWRLAGGKEIPRQRRAGADGPLPWPEGVAVQLEDCPVAVARTRGKYKGRKGVYEVERLYLDAIAKARSSIYIENQYLTSPKISQALAARLMEAEGPEIVIVLPYQTEGWLSQYTMDIMRARVVQELRQADRHGRLGVYYPFRQELPPERSIKVHAKIMVVDDMHARVGSANLNNRSMGLDTECDLALEANPDAAGHEKVIAGFRNRLLSEHLGVTPDEMQEAVGRRGSLLEGIREFDKGERGLKRLEVHLDETAEAIIAQQDLLDPERPISAENLLERLLPEAGEEKGRFDFAGLIAMLLFFFGLAALWRLTPLRDMLSKQYIMQAASSLQLGNVSFLYALAAYVAGGLLIVPITALIALAVLIYGTFKGVLLALAGSCLSASVTYWLGATLGREKVRKLAGNRLNRLSSKLGRRGIVATMAIRLLPVAPFSVINMVAGASHIGFLDFLLGTLLGLLPGTLAIAGVVDRGSAVFTNPGVGTALGLAGALGIIGFAVFFLRRWLAGRDDS